MIALAPTDLDWFSFLSDRPDIARVNFWTPTDWKIRSLAPGDHWYFVLKGSLPRKIGGGGRFVKYETLPASRAWSIYGRGNGAENFGDMVQRLNSFREKRASASNTSKDPIIGCVVLEDPFFLPGKQQKTPEQLGITFPAQVVKFKTYDIPPLEIGAPINAYPLVDELEEAVEEAETSMAFNPSNIDDARRRVMASIVRRRGQLNFRQDLIRVYSGRCAITKCDTEAALEAAHIIPYRGEETNSIANGLLLRADLHTLFDIGLLVISSDFRVVLHPSIRNGHYGALHGQQLSVPPDSRCWPSRMALDEHRRTAGF